MLELGPGGGRGGEFDRLRAIFERLGPERRGRDLGDDCALIPCGDTTLAVSIDASLEGVHFRTDWFSFEEIGWRAAAAALSDLAAEGATAIGALVSLGLPGDGKRETGSGDPGVEIMAGVAAAAASVGAKVLGGDLIGSDKYLVDVCVLGRADRPVRRAGARSGDGLWVTGTLGAAWLALSRLRYGTPLDSALRARYARPEPRLAVGQWLATRGATAMIDISDGLAADARHLAAASEVAVELALERVPCWPGVAPLPATASGEEYELLVALPPSFGDQQARELTQALGVPLTRVGECATGRGLRLLERGQPVAPPAGFDHFAAP
ncbi:MAG: thiamine-phosphate kinase [Gemmatimonadales bacterium]